MTTQSGIRCYPRWTNAGRVREVELSGGRKIELKAREGADDFINTVGSDFISTNLNAINDDEQFISAYNMMITVSQNASPEKIASGIPESEIRIFVKHTLDTLSTDCNWLRSGTLPMCHDLLLCTVASFSKHPSFAKIFLSDEELVKNALQFLKQQGLSYENGFDTIEKTGLLGHYFRCIPVDSERAADTIVSLLLKGLQLVKKKLKSGTPTGDILDAVIAGEDKPINENVKAGLAKIQSLARLSNDHYDYKCGDTIKMCRRCEKVGAEMDGAFLMTCQRCKVTYYCSKECQVANWKSHQKMCYALGRGNESRSAFKTSHTSMRAFIGSRYFAIAKEVYKKTQDHDVPKKKLLVEIDFLGDAPALRNEFNVWLPSDFLKGSSVTDAPDWFRTFDDKKAKKYLAKYVKEKCTQVGSDDLLIVCRAYNGAVTVQRSHFLVANADYQLLSDEAVESIGRQDCARMVACLGKDKTDEYFRELRNSLT